MTFLDQIESGLLQLQVKSGVPNAVSDAAEQPAMLELQRTYGKTIHTWAVDIHPDLPLGPPNLMMSYTGDGQCPDDLVNARDNHVGVNTLSKRKLRAEYLPEYERSADVDQWEKTGKGVVFKPEEEDLKF